MKTASLVVGLAAAVSVAMGNVKVSQQLAERTQRMMDVMSPFANDALVVEEVIVAITNKFTAEPELIKRDSVVIDGMMYSAVDDPDGSVVDALMDDLVEHLKAVGPEGAATITAIAMITGTELLNNHV